MSDVERKVDEILAKLNASENRHLESFVSLLNSIENSLAEVVVQMERGSSDAALQALTAAIKALKPPQVTVQAAAPAAAAAPVVHVMREEAGDVVLELDVQRDKGYGYQPIKRITITRKAGKP